MWTTPVLTSVFLRILKINAKQRARNELVFIEQFDLATNNDRGDRLSQKSIGFFYRQLNGSSM